MLRACTRARSVVLVRRRSPLKDDAHLLSPTAIVASQQSSKFTATQTCNSAGSRNQLAHDNGSASSGWDYGHQQHDWRDSQAVTGTSMMSAIFAALALAGLAVGSGREEKTALLESDGPISFGGDDEDSFQRFPSSNRVHHAIKLARQNTARERRRYYQYVIVGAGTTAKAAIQAILAKDPGADILLLTDEVCLPPGDVYRRDRPLPADLLGAYDEWRRHVSARLENEPKAFSSVPMTVLLGKKRLRLDPQKRSLFLDDGTEVFFGKCLLATAGKPRQFYLLDSEKNAYLLQGRINTLGSLADFESLDLIGPSLGCKDVAVVGGGFLGTEVALAMANRGMKVWQIYAEAAPLSRHLPWYLAEHVKRKLQRHGVEPVAERLVTDVRGGEEDSDDMDMDKLTLSMMGLSKESVTTDYLVMASTHVDPVVDVARDSGLEIDTANGGVVVNGQLEAVSGIYAAGACASYYDQALGRRRADIFEHGVKSGRLAGHNMAVTSLSSRQDRDGWETVQALYEEDDEEDMFGALTGATPSVGSSSAGLGRAGPTEESLKGPAAGAAGPWKGVQNPAMYDHQPAFKSRLEDLDITVDGVGEIDSRIHTVGVWVQGTDAGDDEREGGDLAGRVMAKGSADDAVLPGLPHRFGRGIVYYVDGSRVVGVVLWNASDLLDKARDVIKNQPAISSAEELKTLIALAPDDWLRLVELGSRNQ